MGNDATSTSNAGVRTVKPLQSSSPKTQYLIIYNFISCLLWLVVLGRVLFLVPLVGFGKVYIGVGTFTKWTQTLAVMEVLHSLFGIVRSPVSTTAMQVSSRLLLVWGIVDQFPFLAKSAGYSTMLIAWSVTEVIRYGFFTLSLSGLLPGFLGWLRYNTFYVLYPLGISSECWLIYKAIEPAAKKRIEYDWALKLIVGIYVPGKFFRCVVSFEANRHRILYSFHPHDDTEKQGYEGCLEEKG